MNGKVASQPRDREILSNPLSQHYGLPIDMSAKTGGLKAIANALNEGDISRAQIATGKSNSTERLVVSRQEQFLAFQATGEPIAHRNEPDKRTAHFGAQRDHDRRLAPRLVGFQLLQLLAGMSFSPLAVPAVDCHWSSGGRLPEIFSGLGGYWARPTGSCAAPIDVVEERASVPVE